MRIAVSQPVLSTINLQSPGTSITLGMTGAGMVGRGLRLPDHLLADPFINGMPLAGRPIPIDGAEQMSDEIQKIVSAIADICGAPTVPDMGGPVLRLSQAFGGDRACIDLIQIGIDTGDMVSMMLPGVKPLSVTINLIKIGSGLFGIWHKRAG